MKEVHNLSKNLPDERVLNTDYDTLITLLSEYLDCFIILGFNPEGNDVQIVRAHNPQESSSLTNLAHDFMDRLTNPPPPESN